MLINLSLVLAAVMTLWVLQAEAAVDR